MKKAALEIRPLWILLAGGLATLLTVSTLSAKTTPVEIRVETTLPTAETNRPALALDGKKETFFKSSRSADENDQFTIYFSHGLKLKRLEAFTGDEKGTNQLAAGILEVSTDGKEFKEVAKFEAGVSKAKLKSTPVVAVRIRPIRRQGSTGSRAGGASSGATGARWCCVKL